MVSVLFNEPKLLKSPDAYRDLAKLRERFSALQRAEIAEISIVSRVAAPPVRVSVLFNEPKLLKFIRALLPVVRTNDGFSALQRAEIAEIVVRGTAVVPVQPVSVLFNEPKLLKSRVNPPDDAVMNAFQCSSTSRNC